MCAVRQLLASLCLLVALAHGNAVSPPCIPNTPCQCHLTNRSFILNNCSHSLPDLPVFNANTSMNMTKIVARRALFAWPLHLCEYANVETLDLSESLFGLGRIDLTCSFRWTHLNLSQSQLKVVPDFSANLSQHLQLLDLSANRIELLDGRTFRSLIRLKTLLLQNNPLKHIDHWEHLLDLPRLEVLDLVSFNAPSIATKPLTISQWTHLAHRWNQSTRSFVIRSNSIPLQRLLPHPDEFPSMSLDLWKVVLETLSNSTLTALASTPPCRCDDLRHYQQILSFANDETHLSPLFQSSTCLLANGVIHGRLFDGRLLSDLNCTVMGRMAAAAPLAKSDASAFVTDFIFPRWFIICVIFLVKS